MEYLSPTTVEEAAELLVARPDAKVFAGATDVIPQIRAGRPEPGAMVRPQEIERLVSVRSDGGGWTIGAATPTSQLTGDTELSAEFPGLVEAAGLIGSDL